MEQADEVRVSERGSGVDSWRQEEEETNASDSEADAYGGRTQTFLQGSVRRIAIGAGGWLPRREFGR